MAKELTPGEWVAWEDAQGRRVGKVRDSERIDSYNVELEDGEMTSVGKNIVTKISPPPGEE